MVFREVEIMVNTIQVVQVDALAGYLGGVPRRHEPEHAGEHAAARGALLVGAEGLGGRGGGGGRGGRRGRRRRLGRGGLGAAHRRLGQLAPAPRLRGLVPARRASQLHLSVRLNGGAVSGPSVIV